MVRIIKLLEKSIRRKLNAEQDDTRPDMVKQKEYKYNDIVLSQIDSYENTIFSINRRLPEESLRDLYFELLLIVSGALNIVQKKERLTQEKIAGAVGKVVNEFIANPYNNLLLYAYSLTREDYLNAHIVNDIILTIGFSHFLGLSKRELEEIGFYAFLHDISMADFFTLCNTKARLSDYEFNLIKKHPFEAVEIGKRFLSHEAHHIILDIHEREMGQGYPNGKKGYQISPWAKIISICDVYEALTHPRVFRPEYNPFEAIKVIIKMKKYSFQEKFIKEFINFISIYPIGSMVYLNTGETAIVIASNRERPIKPIVKIVLTFDGKLSLSNKIIDLSKEQLLYIHGPIEHEKERELVSLLAHPQSNEGR